jgi:hypothetical protein
MRSIRKFGTQKSKFKSTKTKMRTFEKFEDFYAIH